MRFSCRLGEISSGSGGYQMRIHNWISRRFFAIVLMEIAGLVGGLLERARSAEPPPENPEIAAAAIESIQDIPSKKEDADAQAKARSMELSTDMVRRCKAATGLVEVRSFGSGSTVCVSANG